MEDVSIGNRNHGSTGTQADARRNPEALSVDGVIDIRDGNFRDARYTLIHRLLCYQMVFLGLLHILLYDLLWDVSDTDLLLQK